MATVTRTLYYRALKLFYLGGQSTTFPTDIRLPYLSNNQLKRVRCAMKIVVLIRTLIEAIFLLMSRYFLYRPDPTIN